MYYVGEYDRIRLSCVHEGVFILSEGSFLGLEFGNFRPRHRHKRFSTTAGTFTSSDALYVSNRSSDCF